jgi:hypothetical protein
MGGRAGGGGEAILNLTSSGHSLELPLGPCKSMECLRFVPFIILQ